ncbi:hypothetical protein ACJJTC_011705 [Scirpophaga incertulas]
MAKRDFVDHISYVEPIDGVVLLDEEYVRGRKVFGQVVCTFRYGREEDEVMGLNFYKELFLASEQIYPAPEKRAYDLSRDSDLAKRYLERNAFVHNCVLRPTENCAVRQERLLKKLGGGPRSRSGWGAGGRARLGDAAARPRGRRRAVRRALLRQAVRRRLRDRPLAQEEHRGVGHPQGAVRAGQGGPQPCTVVRKDFVLSPGQLELEITLDKQLYMHGETVAVNMCVRNHSNKVVKKIKASVQQGVDVVLFQNGTVPEYCRQRRDTGRVPAAAGLQPAEGAAPDAPR